MRLVGRGFRCRSIVVAHHTLKPETKEEADTKELSEGGETRADSVPWEGKGGSPAGDAEGEKEVEATSRKEVEALAPKAEEILEDKEPPVRRRRIHFGSAHLHLPKAVADADAKNWESLQTAISSTSGSARLSPNSLSGWSISLTCDLKVWWLLRKKPQSMLKGRSITQKKRPSTRVA